MLGLTINSGSSSVKFASFDISPGVPPRRILHGEVDGIGAVPRLLAWEHEGAQRRHRAIAAEAWRIELTTPRTIMESYKVLRVGAAEIEQHRDGLFSPTGPPRSRRNSGSVSTV